MSEPLTIDADGPTQTRGTVSFKNWNGEHGLVIRREKLEQDAKNFRRVAKLLAAQGNSGEHQTMSQVMMTMADQFTNASCGYDAQAEAKPYDKPPEMADKDDAAKT